MGAGPNTVEISMFFVLTIAFVLTGIVMSGIIPEFYTGADSDVSVPSIVGGISSATFPIFPFLYLPLGLAVVYTILQGIWYYLIYAVMLRPVLPFI